MVEPNYAVLADLKAMIGMASAVTDRDTQLNLALASSSRWIDQHCGRRFYLDATATERTYRTDGRVAPQGDGEVLVVDDIGSATGLAVTTGVTTFVTITGTVEPQPENAAVRFRPFTGLLLSNQVWPRDPYTRVKVTAKWGWPAVPDIVAQATLLQASRLYRRKDSPDGIAGSADWGALHVARLDSDVAALVQHLQVPGFC